MYTHFIVYCIVFKGAVIMGLDTLTSADKASIGMYWNWFVAANNTDKIMTTCRISV